ncbi:carboxylesterase/lipase family protein [Pedobacter duraquae]|uniref:Carboxylic ester hydrolase n=1 Tax=Pedobacter duraquae TaxID=425511 RepID=A0A4R6IPN1_9SPHI|nr:carboxylesterase family protein [Pedobacter duraquae]TDO24250.1 para-nitrobenzyl esterase [Pedobacter duraquae]
MRSIQIMIALMLFLGGSSIKAQDITVKTSNGILQGSTAGGVNSFKGIPYAQAPVGNLRWKAPQPARNWKAVRKATAFAPRAMQKVVYKDMIFRSPGTSEDCLYLNVWAPANTGKGHLPVLVYFHGGGFSSGDGSEPRYDGQSMAEKGIIVVTVNYRLGIFGFFVHPALTAESPNHASGDYGLLDQQFALKWVNKNIQAFGGDPTQVTIAGQSAGSISVSMHMVSPSSKGLFRAAIGESGSILGTNPPVPLHKAEQLGVDFLANSGLKDIAALRKLPAETLLDLAVKPGTTFFPVVLDGYFLPQAPIKLYEHGLQADIPLLAGWTSAEVGYGRLLDKAEPTLTNYRAAVLKTYGEDGAEVLKLYPAEKEEDVKLAATALAGDRYLGYSTWKWIDLHGKTNGFPVYRYMYSQPLPAMRGAEATYIKPLGAPHSADIAYAMGNLKLDPVYAYTPDDFKTSATMQGYFVNFIKTTDPNGPGLPLWSGFQSSIPQVMYLDANSKQQGEKFLKRYTLLDQIFNK